MKGKLSLLSAAVLLALAGTNTDAAQKPTKAGARALTPAHFKHPNGTTVLYDQTFSSGIGLLSQNFTDSGFSIYSSAGADDFVVTDAAGWTISEVDLTGQYFNGSGPADSFDVTIYNDAGGVPGTVACSESGLSYTNTGGSWQIALNPGCNVSTGTYWVSAKANMAFFSGGEFGWTAFSGGAGAGAVWENPDGGISPGCTTWMSLSAGCFSIPVGDAFSFAIVGHVNTGGGGGISLTVGMAEDNGDPNQCGTATTLSATAGDHINFCYTVTNNSSITLNYQTLGDDVDGPFFTNLNETLAPGASLQYNRIKTATTSETPTATWVAADSLPGYTPTAGTYNFIDISGSGTGLSLSDDGSAAVTAGFSFNFYGASSNQFCVNNNGHALFATSGSCSGNFSNASLPSTDFASPAFLPYWDDFYTGGQDYVATVGTAPNRQFVMEWANKDTFDSRTAPAGAGYTFEIVLNEADNSIDYNYSSVAPGSTFGHDNGASATVGVQLNSSTASEYSFNSADISNSQNIHWAPSSTTAYSASAQVTLDVGAPILSLSPTSLSASAAPGGTTTQTLNIGNTGNRDLDWDLTEAPASAKPSAAPSFASSHYVPDYKFGPKSAGPARAAIAKAKANGQKHPTRPLGGSSPTYAEGFGFSGLPYIEFDLSDGNTWQSITSSMGAYYFAGTFANNDFSTEYVVDYPSNNLWAIDTATGAATNIGPTVGGFDGSTINGLRWDPSTGLTYLEYLSGSSSTLYTVDLTTGTTQLVGSDNGLVIDLAINASGVMYGMDIISDDTVTVDKQTGAITHIGPTGFNFGYAEGMDFDYSDGNVYIIGFDRSAGSSAIYTLDQQDGHATLISPFGGSTLVEADAMAIAVASGPCATPSDIPWLSENPTSGTTPGGGNDPVTVTFDATSLSAGTYDANICVNTNDQNARQEAVPVTFNVTGSSNDEIFANGFDP